MKILVTGANGFIGQAVVSQLAKYEKIELLAAVRHSIPSIITENIEVHIKSLEPTTIWKKTLQKVDVIIHTAARVHILNRHEPNPLEKFRYVNVAGTLNLARQAVEVGVKRFVFISSIKVNGENTRPGVAFTADDKPTPLDPYGVSKLEAEEGLMKIAQDTGLEVVIVRPPLVYGPGVKANFLNMMRWVYKGVPLPFGAIYNQRSLVALDNLVDMIDTCKDHPAAANQVFLVSDGKDLSTSELLRCISEAFHMKPNLIGLPNWFLKAGATAIGKQNIYQRLCGSLHVDIDKTKKILNWTPSFRMEESLKKTAKYFLENYSS
ncbi:SDR family oxidoreductase [Endozoicomonas sp. SM1973]|uniref:SDR family oxidoreductase n=1 Tax=Spartinivicinus marinus TaxID=2994442 RepID=A0A853I0Y5_9GAMM|nr:SDR family oxidoreductase [Spartinivicinus marinus]MCX4028825.1 SDR family oxidoreductase [Spartinivicinus marinus]NYZ67640.1 SDR family oxidoreductase [Spartinivicinus marinus]